MGVCIPPYCSCCYQDVRRRGSRLASSLMTSNRRQKNDEVEADLLLRVFLKGEELK